MENKKKNKSINSVIYLLLGVMLVSIVFVSIFTVASRRGEKNPNETAIGTQDTADGGADSDFIGNYEKYETAPLNEKDNTAEGSFDTENAANADTDNAETDKKTSAENEEVPVVAELRYFIIPTAGTVSKEFEIDVPVYSMTMNDYRAHTGVDISAPLGSEVVAASSGTVCKVWDDPLMGKCVTVHHGDDIYTTYMNLANELDSAAAVGNEISMGQTIGAIGESAIIEISEEPHLHLEMKVDGLYVDPLEYMGVASPQELVYED